MIVPGDTTNEDAALAPRQRSRVISGVFDGAPARLQEQALLRIHVLGLGRRDVEKQRVEQIVLFQSAHPPAVGLAWRCVTGLIVGLRVPAAPWDLGDAIPAFSNVPPKLLEVFSLRELAVHADHRNGL